MKLTPMQKLEELSYTFGGVGICRQGAYSR